MLRLLSYTPLPVHLGLLLVIPLLRLPTFHPDFFLAEESLLLVTAQNMLQAGGIYEFSWHTGPPLMVWIYSGFSLLFGSWALTAIRIFTCIYIYLSAIVFNGILAENKSFRRNAGLISVLFVILVCTPWYSQELNASLFVLLPVVLTFSHISQMADRSVTNQRHMYIAGVWMMIAILASYKTVFLLIGIFMAYLILQSFRIQEVMAFFSGMFTVFAVMAFFLFRAGVLGDWWDQGILYYLDYLGLTGEGWYQVDSLEALKTLLTSWGGFLILAGIGFVHYRIRFYKYVRRARATETMMAIWLVGVLIVLVFKLNRLIMPDFILLVPPLAFYIARTFDFSIVTRFRVLALLILISIPLWQYSGYLGMAFDQQLSVLTPDDDSSLRHGNQLLHKNSHQNLLEEIRSLSAGKRIWVMSDDADIYLRANRLPAVRFSDFRMADVKLEDLRTSDSREMLSSIIPSAESFRIFQENPPALILDAKNNFPSLQNRFPGIFGDYEHRSVGSWDIYRQPQ